MQRISNAPQLQELQSNMNTVSNMDDLAALEHLQTVAFTFNEISDLSPLKNLTSLVSVDFNYNKISDISALANTPTRQHANTCRRTSVQQ